MDPVAHNPGEGEHHDAGPPQIFIKATGEETGGSVFLAESTLASGFFGPPPHRHREVHDMFYVITLTRHRLAPARGRSVRVGIHLVAFARTVWAGLLPSFGGTTTRPVAHLHPSL